MGVKLERNLMKGKITDLTEDEIDIIKNEITGQDSLEDYIADKDILYVDTFKYIFSVNRIDDNEITYNFDKGLNEILLYGLLRYFKDEPEYDQLVNDKDMLKERFNEVFSEKLICLHINNFGHANAYTYPRFYFAYSDYNIYQPISFFNISASRNSSFYLDPISITKDKLIIHECYDINHLIYIAIKDSLPKHPNITNVTLGTTFTINSNTARYTSANKCLKDLLGSSYAEESAYLTDKTYKITLNTVIDLNDFINSDNKLEITFNGLRDVLFENQNCFMTSAHIVTYNNVYSGLVMVVDRNDIISIYPPAYDWDDLGGNDIAIPSDTQFHLSKIEWPK